MKKIKYILLGVLVIAIAGGWYAYYQFHRQNKDLSDVSSDIEITAPALSKAFTTDETAANKTYLDKAVAVKGKVKAIEKDEKGLYTVLLGTDVDDNSISCEMDQKHNDDAAKLNKGDEVVMKGICTGILIDVVLVRCVIDK